MMRIVATKTAPTTFTVSATPSVAVGQARARDRRRQEAGEDGHGVETHQALLASTRGNEGRCGHQDQGDTPLGYQEPVDSREPDRNQAFAGPAETRQRLEYARTGQIRGRGSGEEQQCAARLEGREQRAAPGCAPRDFGDQGGIARGKIRPESDGERGEGDRQRADDPDHQPEREASEPAPSAIVELRQLGDRIGGRLDSGCQRHTQRDGEEHRGQSRAVQRGCSFDADTVWRRRTRRCGDTGQDHPRRQHDESQGRNREDDPPGLAQQDPGGDHDDEPESDRCPQWSQVGEIGDEGRCARRAADRHGEREVDQQCSQWDECPALAEGVGNAVRATTSLGEASDQLVIGRGYDADDRHDRRHRGKQLCQIAVQRTQRRLDRIGDGGDRICHHGESETEGERDAARPHVRDGR